MRRMELAMRSARGIGLAANQIGYTYNMFIVAPSGKTMVAINPRIVEVSDKLIYDSEGCLSIRGKTFIIPRPEWVTILSTDLDGSLIESNHTDMYARCIMHEIDHLSGRLISDEKDENDNVSHVGKRATA